MSELQEHDDEFNDPVLEQTDSTPLWWLRRAFAVAFYESDDKVSKGDWMVAYGIGLVLAIGAVGGSFAYHAVTKGTQDAVTELTTTMSGEGIGAGALVETAVLAVSFTGGFLAIAATWKLFSGGLK